MLRLCVPFRQKQRLKCTLLFLTVQHSNEFQKCLSFNFGNKIKIIAIYTESDNSCHVLFQNYDMILLLLIFFYITIL
jgi:hypothetical protein